MNENPAISINASSVTTIQQYGPPYVHSMDGTLPIIHFTGEEFWTEDPANPGADLPRGEHGTLTFQHGPLKEVGVNGTTIEAVMRAILERLRGFNNGPFRCRENSLAITHFEEGLHWLYARTRARQEQNVEGVNAAHVS